MAEYLHGAYRDWPTAGSALAVNSNSAVVVFGTAPVQTAASGNMLINKPVLVNSFAEAKKLFGYSEDWAKYTLCEAMYLILACEHVGPLVLVNVLDPNTHKGAAQTVSQKPDGGKLVLTSAEDIILSTIAIEDIDADVYTAVYDPETKTITIREKTAGGLGTDTLSISFNKVDVSAVTNAVMIGSSTSEGVNTGIHAVRSVYQETGIVPAFLLAPGWSSIPEVHAAMGECSRKINGHWDAWIFADLPTTITGTPNYLTMATAAAWKEANGYNLENETVCFPKILGTDDKVYHMATYRAACFMKLLAENDGVPFHSASNTAAAMIRNLKFAAEVNAYSATPTYDDTLVNEYLCRNGITSAAFVGGQWVLWGAHAADYNEDTASDLNVSETVRMMLYFVANSFQQRRCVNVDKPLSANDLAAIVAEEQGRLDALVNVGALTYGKAYIAADEIALSDMYKGDYLFSFDITTMPLAKSLTVRVKWVDDGLAVYYQSLTGV